MKRKGTGLFARYAYVTTALGTKRHRVTNKERAEAYRLRSKHRDILEMATPARPHALTDQDLKVLKYSGEGRTDLQLRSSYPETLRTSIGSERTREADDEPLF